MSWTLRFHVLLSVVMAMASLKGSAQLVVWKPVRAVEIGLRFETTVPTR